MSTNTATCRLDKMSKQLNYYGALLAGIEEICKRDDVSGNALEVAGNACRRMNRKICRIADELSDMAKKGGEA